MQKAVFWFTYAKSGLLVYICKKRSSGLHMQNAGFFHDQLIYNIQDFPGAVLKSFHSTVATHGLVFFLFVT